MREKKRGRAKAGETVTVFLRVHPTVKNEFERQAKKAHRNLTGHFEALVESGREKAA